MWTVIATVMLHHGSQIAPGALIGNGAGVFAVGMMLLVAGAGLRWWSFWARGQYFTFTVDVSSDQQIVAAGAYRVQRHPGYAGGLLAMIGIGLVYANWVSLAGFAVPCLIIIIWRIRIEEAALLRTAGPLRKTGSGGASAPCSHRRFSLRARRHRPQRPAGPDRPSHH